MNGSSRRWSDYSMEADAIILISIGVTDSGLECLNE